MQSTNRKARFIVRFAGILMAITLNGIIASSCAKPSEGLIQTAIAKTKIVEPTGTLQPTYTPYPTYTPNIIVVTATNSPTSEFTLTPSSTPTITYTPTETVPPTNTFTFTPTVTKTKEPGIGVDIKCGDKFIVNVLTKPQKETYFYGEKPSGEFWLFKVQITNLMGVTHDLNRDDFSISAMVNGQNVVFSSHWDATFDWVYHNWGGLIYPNDDIGPTLTSKVGIAFDVNPKSENPRFVWTPRDNMFDDLSDALCRVSIPIE